MGKIEEAQSSLRRMSRWNKIDADDDIDQIEVKIRNILPINETPVINASG